MEEFRRRRHKRDKEEHHCPKGASRRRQQGTRSRGRESERPIVLELRIADPWDFRQAGPLEPRVGLFGTHGMHERHRRSGRIDGPAHPRDIGQGLATERSTEVAEEDDQRRLTAGQRLERGAGGVGDGGHLHLVIS